MRPFLMVFVALTLVGFSPTSMYADHHEVTVTGELVDHACYTKRDGAGSGHAACAKDCAMKGMPVALVTESGDVYMLGGAVTDDNNASIAPHMAHIVEVTGEVAEAGGVKTISTASIKHVSVAD